MDSPDILTAEIPAGGILIVAAGGIGDAILLAHLFPRFAGLAGDGETVTLVLRGDAAKAAFLFQGLAQVVAVDFARLRSSFLYRRRVFNCLKRAKYRLAISADYKRHPKLDEALILASGATEIRAMKARPWSKYDRQLQRGEARFTGLYDSGPVLANKILRWTGFLDWLGADGAPPVLRFAPERCPPATPIDRPLIVLAPFSAEILKQSPAALYAKILDHLGSGYDVLLSGAPTDLDANPEFKPLLERPNTAFDGASFEALAPRLRAATLVVAADTATMHLAVAMGAPTLCLASAAYVGEIVPYAAEITPANAHFIHVPMDCQSCLGTCVHPPEAGMYPCVAAIDERQVIENIDRILNQPNLNQGGR
jgi:ADP-heptose:LPS heptosyltransferase